MVEWGTVNLVIDGLEQAKFCPFIFLGIYKKLPFTLVQIFASLPFLFMIFFSAAFSPGSGVEGLKALCFFFARFYFWCMIPGVRDDMENCPADDEFVPCMIWSPLIGLAIPFEYQGTLIIKRSMTRKQDLWKKNSLKDGEFVESQRHSFVFNTKSKDLWLLLKALASLLD